MSLENGVRYLAFGVRQKAAEADISETRKNRTYIGAPWQIFAVSGVNEDGFAEAPYYKVLGWEGNDPVVLRLENGSHQYNKVHKWVGDVKTGPESRAAQRKIFSSTSAGCIVSQEEAKYRLLETQDLEDAIAAADAFTAPLRFRRKKL